MSLDTRNRRFSKVGAAVVAAIGLCSLALPLAPAKAQVPYLGVDFGGGFGVGLGVPPSAYGAAPMSPLYPFYAPYYAPAPVYYPYPW